MSVTQPVAAPSASWRSWGDFVPWGLILGLALGMRLIHLDAAPLSAREAREAMLAWQAASGQGMPDAQAYSPLLFLANAWLFHLFGASDAAARLWPALFGSALVLAPFLLQERIGRTGALMTGLCLAVSPTALFASRQVDGTVIAMAGGLAFLGGLVRASASQRRSWLVLSGIGLGIAVTASGSAYGLLLALGLAWLIFSWVWQGTGSENLPERETWRLYTWPVLGPFGFTVLLCATGLGWNPGGLGAMGELLLDRLPGVGPEFSPAASPLTILLVYEPLVVALGLAGLVRAVVKKDRFGILLGIWAGIGFLALVLDPAREPLDALWVVLPLALLAGGTAAGIVGYFRGRRKWGNERLYVPMLITLLAYCFIRMARYSVNGDAAEAGLALFALGLPFILVLFVFGLLGLAGLGWLVGIVDESEFHEITMGVKSELRDAAAAGLGIVLPLALLFLTFSTGWGVAQVRPNDPRELLVRDGTADSVRDLVSTLRSLSWRKTGEATMLPSTLVAESDSLLAWYLRDFGAMRRVDSFDPDLAREALPQVVVSHGLSPYRGYVGQDFALRYSWDSPTEGCGLYRKPLGRGLEPKVQCGPYVRWLLFRQTSQAPQAAEWAVLWVEPQFLAP